MIFEATWLRSWRVMRYKSAKQVSKHYLRQRIIEGFFNNSIALKYFTNTSQYVSVWLCFLALHNFTENHLFQASSPVCSTFPPFSESIKSSRWDIGCSGSKKITSTKPMSTNFLSFANLVVKLVRSRLLPVTSYLTFQLLPGLWMVKITLMFV